MSVGTILRAAIIVVLAASVNACVASSESDDPATDDGGEQVGTAEEAVVGCHSSFSWAYGYANGGCYASYGYQGYRVWVWCDNETSYAGNWASYGYGSTVFCPVGRHAQASWMQVNK